MKGLCHINKNRLRDNLAVILLHWHVTTNVVSAIPSINEYCMNVNVDARSAGEFNSKCGKMGVVKVS